MADKEKRSKRMSQKYREGISDFFNREAGAHDNKSEKKRERHIKEALHKLNLDELEEL